MEKATKEVLEFFKSRRSVSVNFLGPPGPNQSQLSDILKMGLRCPDHGRLEPWRILVISEENAKNKRHDFHNFCLDWVGWCRIKISLCNHGYSHKYR